MIDFLRAQYWTWYMNRAWRKRCERTSALLIGLGFVEGANGVWNKPKG